MKIDAERRAVTDEVEFWLWLSASFYDCFKIKKDPGPSWFLLNEVLRETDRPLTVGEAIDALSAAGVVRSKPAYDVTQYSRQLCELGLLDYSGLELDRKRVLPVSTELRPSIGSERPAERYARKVLERLFDRRAADHALEEFSGRTVINKIYDYMRSTYIPLWEKHLISLAQVAVQKTKGRQSTVFGYLRGSSEVFVLLHGLWEAHLLGENENGFSLTDLKDLHLRTRVSSLTAIANCVEQLCKHRILNKDEHECFRLHDDNLPLFEEYIPSFIKTQGLFKQHLNNEIFANHEDILGSAKLT